MSASLSPERVDWHLWNWERWMHCASLPGRLSKQASGGVRGYTNYDGDYTEEYAEADRSAAAAVQAILDGLPPAQRTAVYVRYRIVTHHGIVNVDAYFTEACSVIAAQMPRRGFC